MIKKDYSFYGINELIERIYELEKEINDSKFYHTSDKNYHTGVRDGRITYICNYCDNTLSEEQTKEIDKDIIDNIPL